MWKIVLAMVTTLTVNSGATTSNTWLPSSKPGNYFGWSGHWGGWGAIQYCPQNSKAVGFRLQVGYWKEYEERWNPLSDISHIKSTNDLVGVNAICLVCERGGEVCSRKGSTISPRTELVWSLFRGMLSSEPEKTWYSSVTKMGGKCADGFTEAAFKWEDKQHGGDDTAGNEVALVCGETPEGRIRIQPWLVINNNAIASHRGERKWFYSGRKGKSYGKWLFPYKKCPKGTRICGLRTQVERWMSGDITGLNGVWFTCCANIKEVHADGRIEMTDGTYRVKMTDGTYCEKYSKKACKAAIKQNGLIEGGKSYDFEGNYGTKGCYAYSSGTYKGHAYYGTGGTESQMAAKPSDAKKYRPDGYDCQ